MRPPSLENAARLPMSTAERSVEFVPDICQKEEMQLASGRLVDSASA